MEAGTGCLVIASLMADRSGKKAGRNEARPQALKLGPDRLPASCISPQPPQTMLQTESKCSTHKPTWDTTVVIRMHTFILTS